MHLSTIWGYIYTPFQSRMNSWHSCSPNLSFPVSRCLLCSIPHVQGAQSWLCPNESSLARNVPALQEWSQFQQSIVFFSVIKAITQQTRLIAVFKSHSRVVLGYGFEKWNFGNKNIELLKICTETFDWVINFWVPKHVSVFVEQGPPWRTHKNVYDFLEFPRYPVSNFEFRCQNQILKSTFELGSVLYSAWQNGAAPPLPHPFFRFRAGCFRNITVCPKKITLPHISRSNA